MALLWNPESWSQRLAELEAQSGDLKEAPLRRDVRSLGMLLGEVLREQAGDDLYDHVEALRQGTTRRRDAEARGNEEEPARHGAMACGLFFIAAGFGVPAAGSALAQRFHMVVQIVAGLLAQHFAQQHAQRAHVA